MNNITWIAAMPETTLGGWFRVAYQEGDYFDKAMFDDFDEALNWIAEIKAQEGL